MDDKVTMDKVVSLCKRRGFVFPGSDIYGGFASTWDYGPYGSQLKKNVKDYWWKTFVQERDDMVGCDAAILMNPRVWEASGHIGSFSDPLMDCKNCNERVRGDKLIENHISIEAAAGKSLEEVTKIVSDEKLPCPKCGKCDFTEARAFNLMFKTHQGVIEDTATAVYLRPETAQGIFVNFKNIVQNCRQKIPFGIAQIGKAFRNEITPGNFIFRTREFEQMEIEYFVHPDDMDEKFEEWKVDMREWFLSLGVNPDNLRFREHEADELSHYSTMTYDIEYDFPFGWGELMGVACRGCFDLSQHQKFSGQKMEYVDPKTNEKYIPHVIEPSCGLDRTVLTVLIDAYNEDEIDGESRVVMRFDPKVAPVKCAIFPLMKKNGMAEKAREVFDLLKKDFMVEYDDSGAIGKRYRRHDEVGTPFCLTIDFDTLEDGTVTWRDRDSTEQNRVKIEDLKGLLSNALR